MKNLKIKCECGKEFTGWQDKEDTCPSCLKDIIKPSQSEPVEKLSKEKRESYIERLSNL